MGNAFVYILAIICGLISAQEYAVTEFTVPNITEFLSTLKNNDTPNINISAPSSPTNLTIRDATDTSLTLQWNAPEKPNGELKGYRIYFTHGNYTDIRKDTTNPKDPVKTYVLNELKPDTQYSITVKAFSTKHEGNISQPIFGRTDIMGPSSPIIRNVSCEYNNSITVKFDRPERIPDSLDMYYIDTYENGIALNKTEMSVEKRYESITYVIKNVTTDTHYDIQVYAASKSNRTGHLVMGEKSKFVRVFVSEGCYIPSEPLTELWAGIMAGFMCAIGVLLLGGGGYLIWK